VRPHILNNIILFVLELQSDIEAPSDTIMVPVVSATSPSTMGKKLIDASVDGKDDAVRELLKTATAEEVNWQNEVQW